MSEPTHSSPHDPVHNAFQEGRRIGLATAALALGVVSFLNLLGLEKSILAIVLALLAMQGAEPVTAAFRRGRTALMVSAVHVLTIVVVLVLFHDKLLQLLHKLS